MQEKLQHLQRALDDANEDRKRMYSELVSLHTKYEQEREHHGILLASIQYADLLTPLYIGNTSLSSGTFLVKDGPFYNKVSQFVTSDCSYINYP
jgi:hypothetical protein